MFQGCVQRLRSTVAFLLKSVVCLKGMVLISRHLSKQTGTASTIVWGLLYCFMINVEKVFM